MRDPTRIRQVLEIIQDAWERHPDLRLGQLILKVFNGEYLYTIEDVELGILIKKFYQERD